MYAPFHTLPAESRIWIYQATRKLTPEEVTVAEQVLLDFCDEWAAHGTPLKTSFKIEQEHFIILSVDEGWSGASGCSIDGSVRILKGLEIRFGISLMDRTNAAFPTGEEGNEVKLIPVKDIKAAVESGILSSSTLAFHTLAASKGELDGSWVQPLEKTWMARFLPKKTIA